MIGLSEDDVSNRESALGIPEVLKTVDIGILVSEGRHAVV
jgi:hypothetical protein